MLFEINSKTKQDEAVLSFLYRYPFILSFEQKTCFLRLAPKFFVILQKIKMKHTQTIIFQVRTIFEHCLIISTDLSHYQQEIKD